MGAGVAKVEVNQPSTSSSSTEEMSCEACSIRFSILKRRKLCCECGKSHCSGCLTKSPATNGIRRRCQKCQLLVSGRFTRDDLMNYKVKDLRAFLVRRNVVINDCTEKADLVEALLRFTNNSQYRLEQEENNRRMQNLQRRTEDLRQRLESPENPPSTFPEPPSYHEVLSGNFSQPQQQEESVDPPSSSSNSSSFSSSTSYAHPSSNHTSSAHQPSTTHQSTEESNHQSAPQAPKRARIEQIKSATDIEELTVLQLKEILATSYVDYKGCVEKYELVERVRRLFTDTCKNKQKVEELEAQEEQCGTNDADLCKICMENLIDCVLLECGHMVTCTQCGKQMAECPICRQYVVRVVHVFK